MRYRRLALLVVLYLSLDLTNPFIGCAFNFNLDQSVEGVSRQHERPLIQADRVGLPTAPMRSETTGARRATLVERPEVRALAEWFVALRQGHATASDPSPEDH
jgi:hypothetical protein